MHLRRHSLVRSCFSRTCLASYDCRPTMCDNESIRPLKKSISPLYPLHCRFMFSKGEMHCPSTLSSSRASANVSKNKTHISTKRTKRMKEGGSLFVRYLVKAISMKVGDINALKARLAIFESAFNELYHDNPDAAQDFMGLCEYCEMPYDRDSPPAGAIMCEYGTPDDGEQCTNVLVCNGPGCASPGLVWAVCGCGLKCCEDHTQCCHQSECGKIMCEREDVRRCRKCWQSFCATHTKQFVYDGSVTALCNACSTTWAPNEGAYNAKRRRV